MKSNFKKLCTITVGMDYLLNDYIFYSNGMIRHRYSKSTFTYSFIKWIKPGELNSIVERRIIENCPGKYKRQVRQILEFNLRMN